MTGKGVTPYWDYDCAVAEAAEHWLETQQPDGGWTAFVSFVLPHFPLNAPDRFRALYDAGELPLPKASPGYQPENATMAAMRGLLDFQDHFTGEAQLREAVAHYHALCSALDENVGRVLDALERSGAAEDTLVIYASDHGDNVGARGFWGKSTLWEESAGVPIVVSGPGIPAGRVNPTPVSLIDLAPTIRAVAGLPPRADLPGRSLMELARETAPNRPVMAEYHAVGARTGMFMLRLGRHKLIECVGDEPLLYDLQEDPEELVNIAGKPEAAEALRACRLALQAIVNPLEANAQAFRDQAELAARFGGEAAVRANYVPVAFTDPREKPAPAG